MLFNSAHFIIFFPLVLLGYFALPSRFRNIFLLAASYYFYGSWKIEYLLLLVGSTTVDYIAGLLIDRSNSHRTRKFYLALSLFVNLGVLFIFKYFNFFRDSYNPLVEGISSTLLLPSADLLLPIGISFYTFQSISYTIDVYRKARSAEHNFLTFSLYISFFPQLVAGPIERSTTLLSQFKSHKYFNFDRVISGFRLMLVGFFKKIVLADNFAHFAESAFSNPGSHFGPEVLIAAYAFGFQIYYDFSGYTDIARGAARVLGYDLMENFRTPYLAASISEFWQRWHISLSTWFRDYLYIPLGGNKKGKFRWSLNILVVFTLSGLWHGANWTFFIWGLLHALFFLSAKVLAPTWKVISNIFPANAVHLFEVLLTFHLVTFSWIFFRANSLDDAYLLVNNLFILGNLKFGMQNFYSLITPLLFGLLIFIIFTFGLRLASLTLIKVSPRSEIYIEHTLKHGVIYGMIIGILLFGVFKKIPFIYFQF